MRESNFPSSFPARCTILARYTWKLLGQMLINIPPNALCTARNNCHFPETFLTSLPFSVRTRKSEGVRTLEELSLRFRYGSVPCREENRPNHVPFRKRSVTKLAVGHVPLSIRDGTEEEKAEASSSRRRNQKKSFPIFRLL